MTLLSAKLYSPIMQCHQSFVLQLECTVYYLLNIKSLIFHSSVVLQKQFKLEELFEQIERSLKWREAIKFIGRI